jgi:hypothetical protein
VTRRSRPLIVAALATCFSLGTAAAQPPRGEADIAWTAFVGGDGDPRRVAIGAEPGTLDLGDSPWSCGYARPRHATIGGDDWSVQRVLACRRGEATVTSTASCRVHAGRVEERAATLNLGTTGADGHVTVTLSCRARGR